MAAADSMYLVKSSTQSDSKNVWCTRRQGGYFYSSVSMSKESLDYNAATSYYAPENICFHPLVREVTFSTVIINLTKPSGVTSSLSAGAYRVRAIKGITWYEMLKSAHSIGGTLPMELTSDGRVKVNDGYINLSPEATIVDSITIQIIG